MRTFLAELRSKPVIERFATAGLLVGLVIGAVAGLIRGLEVHPATAWFAVFEIGLPAAIVGALLGFVCGAAVIAARWIRRQMAVRA